MTKRSLLCCFFALILFFPFYTAERIVTIESARTSEYIKTDQGVTPDDADKKVSEIIRFTGSVMIVVTEGSSVSRISADEIVYDKNRDTLEARGNVKYEHSTGKASSEKFSGEALLFNIKKQEGVFLDGEVTQDSGKKTSDPYIIHAEVTGRDASSTLAFKNGVLTTCNAEDPHWSINASRIWLLPGNEIAILNGIFFIGPLPVFYIPVFYYPSDEMIVHPVYGFRNREGYFVQTTTYLLGRKPLPVKTGTGSGNSFSDFLQGDTLKEQKANGLFLRNLEEDAKTTNSDYLKFMADAYSSLGALVGLDGSFSPNGYIKNIKVSGAIGFSRTLYVPSTGLFYSTYNSIGEEQYNSGWFYGTELPFRYRANFSVSMDKKPFQISINAPIISDPFFKTDFLNRSEDLNWFKFLTDQDTLAKTNTTISSETSYSWNVTGSINPDVSFASPYLKTFSVSNLSGLLTFNSKENKTITTMTSPDYDPLSPERNFFYPEIIKPEIRLSLGGTLFSSETTSSSKTVEKVDTAGITDPFKDMVQADSATAVPDQKQVNKEDIDRYIPSVGSGFVPSVNPAVSTYSITWTMEPSFLQETRYNSTAWLKPEDIDWNKYSSLYYQIKNTAKLAGSYAWDANFFSVNSTLNYTGNSQFHPWLSDSVYKTRAEKNIIQFNDYTANIYAITTTDSIQLVPFNRDPFFKPVSIAWNFAGSLIRTKFNGTAEIPDWKTETFEWDKEYITAHTATAVAGIALANYEQKLSITSNLAPLLESYSGLAGFAWPFGTLNMNSRLFEKEKDTKKWFWDPFTAKLAWTLPFGITLAQEYIYDIEEETSTRLNFTANKGYFSAFYTVNNTIPYILKEGSGWILDGTEKDFIPSAAGFTFNNSSKPLQLYQWKNRIFLQTNISSNLQFNLLKLTDSSFDFVPTITFKIFEFLDLSFSSNSRNDVIARYFQDWVQLPAVLPGETNIVTDLIKSFNFANREERSQTGFKLKSLNVALTHYLHDWTMSLTTSVKPELKTVNNISQYEFVPTVVFLVQWKPISDIKTTVKSEKGVFTLNTTDTSSSPQ